MMLRNVRFTEIVWEIDLSSNYAYLLRGSNPLDCVRLSSIGSEIELTQIRPFDFVRLPNSIELNPRIEFD